MKFRLHIFLIFQLFLLYSCKNNSLREYNLENIDFCKYFRIEVNVVKSNGKTGLSYSPEIIKVKNDALSGFIQKHKHRFEYLLLNKTDSLSNYIRHFPDTSRINLDFCNDLKKNQNFNFYFLTLANLYRDSDLISPPRFSVKDLMLVASRFFMCDEINKKDTTIGSHICVGINGQKEINSNKDYAVLEAFCFEGIFSYLRKQPPRFVKNFENYIEQVSNREKLDFTGFDSHLEKVKNQTYILMENDEDLRKKLLKFYRKNKRNIGFTIE